ncbi:MAG: SH3 domain-containing protein [Acetatifactor sp.]|nr:SH3 domain-containing protein [Acetatifactor sp.]
MIRKVTKAAVGVLTASLAFSTLGITADAEENASSVFISGGVGFMLAQGNNKTDSLTSNYSMQLEGILEASDLDGIESDERSAEDTEEELYRNLVIAQVRKYVNVRSIPSEEGEILGKLYNNSVGTFISEENGWYQITSGNVTGYVKADYCVTGDDAVEIAKQVGKRFATVTTQTLFVRKEPSTQASILSMVPEAEELLILDEVEGWVQVDVEEGTGWISKDYVEIHSEFVQAESKEEEAARLKKEEAERKKAREAAAKAAAASPNSSSQTSDTTSAAAPATSYSVGSGSAEGVAVAEYALQFVGNPYVYGGTSLTKGADCSGFVMSVYANFGVSLPHSSAADRTQGYAVDGLENAQPGDLICYSGHVALYIGNGQIVHASNKRTGIIVSNVDYRKILAIRRIF